MPWDYLLVAGIVFAINLLPAFGPPTSAVLVALTLSFDLASVPLIASGAVAAACGRYVLASGARRVRPHLSAERRVHLAAVERYLVENRARTIAGLGLFALSPVPSGQLFTGAGLMEVSLLPLTAAFFAGRLVSYTAYVTAASAIKDTFGQALVGTITSPIGIAVQVVALAALVAFLRVDWAHVLGRKAIGTQHGSDDHERRRDPDGPPDLC